MESECVKYESGKQQAAGWAKTNKEDIIYKKTDKELSLTRGRGQNGRIRCKK